LDTVADATYAYDITGRLGSVTSPAGTFTYGYLANSMGLLHTVTGPAHTVTNTWETTRDVLTEKENKVGTTVVSAYDYSVNPLGQRTEVAKTGTAFASNRSIAWGYDALGQVTTADSSITGFDRAYEFDGIGNRKKAADSLTLPATDNYTANALNQYTAVDTINPAYDDDGNATAYPLPAHLTANCTLNWDAENRLISATVNGTTTTYLYDAASRRIAQTTGTTTVYVYDGWNPVAEYTGTSLTKTYTWGLDLSGSLQGAGGVGGLLAVTDASSSHFPTYDGNGNISEYLNSAGASAAHYEYDAFGRTTVASGIKAGDFAHRFSTKHVDSATGLHYYGYRWFDPVTGRWPSRDLIGEMGGNNLYCFIYNDGIKLIDVFGLWFADGSEMPSLAELKAGGMIFLKGDCGYDYKVDNELARSMETAAENHEKLHIEQVKGSDDSHAVPYKQLFCRAKKNYYYSAEHGALQRKDWTGELGDIEKAKKALLWNRDRAVMYSTVAEEATNESAALVQERDELLGVAFKEGATVIENDNGVFTINGEKKSGVEKYGQIVDRITTTLSREIKRFSGRLNNQTPMQGWSDLILAYTKEREAAKAAHEEFSFPIPSIIYNELNK